MTRRASGAAEWEMPADDHDEDALGPEDYAWLALAYEGRPSDEVPRLTWIWDRSAREQIEHLIAVAVQGPLGSA